MKQRAAEAATAAQATISAHVYHEIRNVVGSVLALADRATEAVDLALIEEDNEVRGAYARYGHSTPSNSGRNEMRTVKPV